MSNQNMFDIKYHFSLLNDIVLFGETNNINFICIITKNIKIKKSNFHQNEACIYIKDNDGKYYNIQVTIFPNIVIQKPNKPKNEIFIELLQQYAEEIYINLKNNSTEITIKEKNNKFKYFLYDIPAYIWCVAMGMITTKL